MKNKILISVYVPTLDETYEIYIPSNETIKVILELITKTISDLSDSNFNSDDEHYLLNTDTSVIYLKNQIVRDTDIINSKKLVLV